MTTLNLPAAYAVAVTPSDTVPLPGKCSFLYATNAGASAETITIRSLMPESNGHAYDVAITIPAGVTLPIYIQASYVLATGTGADVTAVACYN